MVNYGPDAGKLAVIVDIIDHNRVCCPALLSYFFNTFTKTLEGPYFREQETGKNSGTTIHLWKL